MATAMSTSAETLLELFGSPILRISQLTTRSDEDENRSISRTWGGSSPVFVFELDGNKGSYLYVAASDSYLLMRVAQAVDENTLTQFLNDISEEEADREGDYDLGLFDLDSVVCPVPQWEKLSVTSAHVLTTTDGRVIGFCVHVNLGVRIGIFVSPYAGATLAFNDSCDEVIRQAKSAEALGVVRVLTRDYTGTETPKQMETIDWFDWLRNGK